MVPLILPDALVALDRTITRCGAKTGIGSFSVLCAAADASGFAI